MFDNLAHAGFRAFAEGWRTTLCARDGFFSVQIQQSMPRHMGASFGGLDFPAARDDAAKCLNLYLDQHQ